MCDGGRLHRPTCVCEAEPSAVSVLARPSNVPQRRHRPPRRPLVQMSFGVESAPASLDTHTTADTIVFLLRQAGGACGPSRLFAGSVCR
jgi:hypothetical protein